MNDLGSFLFALATLALLSLFDAFARRAAERQRRREQAEQAERAEEGEASGRPMPTEIWIPGTDDEEWAPDERSLEERGRRERSLEERGQEEWSLEERAPEWSAEERPAAAGPREPERAAPPPPLVAAGERLRAEGRREIRERTFESGPSVEAPAAPGPAHRRPAPAPARADSLRSVLREDRDALRRAVLYREVLGEPLALRGPGGWEEPGGRG